MEIEKLTLRRCEDPCAKGKSFVTFNHDGLKQQIAQLQSSSTRDLMKDTFTDMFEGVRSWSPWNLYRLSRKFLGWMSFSAQMSEALECHHIRGRSRMAISIGWQLHQWLRVQRQVACYFWNWVSPLRCPQAAESHWPTEVTS